MGREQLKIGYYSKCEPWTWALIEERIVENNNLQSKKNCWKEVIPVYLSLELET